MKAEDPVESAMFSYNLNLCNQYLLDYRSNTQTSSTSLSAIALKFAWLSLGHFSAFSEERSPDKRSVL